MKKIFTAVGLTIMFAVASLLTVSAREITLFDNENVVDENLSEVNIRLNAPEDFTERVEVYLNKEEHPMFKDMGYNMNLELENGSYEVVVLSSTDVLDKYEFIYDDVLTVSGDTSFSIDVKNSITSSESDSTSLEDPGFTNVEGDDMLLATPAFYDFSNGQTAGTLHISCKDYPAFETVIFSLTGGPDNSLYEIKLDRDNWFSADVLLPVGSYFENSDFDFTYSEGINADDVTFIWQHEGTIGNFGKHYNITENSDISITDLVIYMTYNGEITEVNTDTLVSGKTFNEQLEAKQKHNLKELQSAFPDEYTEETISAAEPIEKNNNDFILKISIAVIMITIIAAGVTIIIIRKKNSLNQIH